MDGTETPQSDEAAAAAEAPAPAPASDGAPTAVAEPAAAMPQAVADAPPAAPHPMELLVERWWNDHFPGSPVAQVTAAWNHAFAAKEELKRRLNAL